MDDYLSEAAAWRYIADMIEQGEWKADGLCVEVMNLYRKFRIDGATECDMLDRIVREQDKGAPAEGSENMYLFPCGAAGPRIVLAHQFAAAADRGEL